MRSEWRRSVIERGEPKASVRAFLLLFVLGWVAACVGPGDGPDRSPALDAFVTGQPARTRVGENVKECMVDAVCTLELEFTDTTVVALYGTGERPATMCPIPIEASDVAFGLGRGDEVTVVLAVCPGLGLVVSRASVGEAGT